MAFIRTNPCRSEAQFKQIEHCLPRQRGDVSLSNLQVLNAIPIERSDRIDHLREPLAGCVSRIGQTRESSGSTTGRYDMYESRKAIVIALPAEVRSDSQTFSASSRFTSACILLASDIGMRIARSGVFAVKCVIGHVDRDRLVAAAREWLADDHRHLPTVGADAMEQDHLHFRLRVAIRVEMEAMTVPAPPFLMRPFDRPPQLKDVATLLNTSERTLKRRLQEEGACFRDISNTVRKTRAQALGFSDMSSFSQAYKRWTGVAPSVSRQAAAGA